MPGAIGRATDLTVRPTFTERCTGRPFPSGPIGASLIDAGFRNRDGTNPDIGQIVLPLHGAVRLATVEVAGRDLLIAVTGSSIAELDQASEVIDSFDVISGPDPAEPAASSESMTTGG